MKIMTGFAPYLTSFFGVFFGSSSDHLREFFGKMRLFPKSFRRALEGLSNKMIRILNFLNNEEGHELMKNGILIK
jgi:hypothetical protein